MCARMWEIMWYVLKDTKLLVNGCGYTHRRKHTDADTHTDMNMLTNILPQT